MPGKRVPFVAVAQERLQVRKPLALFACLIIYFLKNSGLFLAIFGTVNHWDYEIKKTIPFEEMPFCNWNISGVRSYQNHLLGNFDQFQNRIALFRSVKCLPHLFL